MAGLRRLHITQKKLLKSHLFPVTFTGHAYATLHENLNKS